MKRILLATDFSESSREASEHALALARALQAEVVLLHVVELPAGLDPHVMVRPDPEGPMLPVGEHMAGEAWRRLAGPAAAFRDAGVQVTPMVEVGKIAATLVEKARGADLIVLGTHGRTGLRHMLLGSVAERVLRTSEVPVMVVRRAVPDALLAEEQQARVETEG